MAPRLLVPALVLGLGGCAQLIGADDPAAAFEVDPRIANDYLLAIHADNTTGFGTYLFFANLDNIDVDERTFDLSIHALDANTRIMVGVEHDFEGIYAHNDETFTFIIDPFDLVIDDAATGAAEGEVELAAVLDGQFPILDGETATTSAFCGTIAGAAISPKASLESVTFAAFVAEFPTAATPALGCDDLPP